MKKKVIFTTVIVTVIVLCWFSDKQNQKTIVKESSKEVPQKIINPLSLETGLKCNEELELKDDVSLIEQKQQFIQGKDYNEVASLIENKVNNLPLLGKYIQKQNEHPLLFLENKGQVSDIEGNSRSDILYVAKSNSTNVFITSSALHYQFTNIKIDSCSQTVKETHRFSIQLENVNPSPFLETSEPELYTENYYNEYFPDGLIEVRSFKEITMKDIYPGIDWIIYSKGSFMEYDFIVHPGADPKQIRFRVIDADNSSLTENGDLQVDTKLGKVLKHAPISFVEEQQIASHFEVYDDGSYGFDVIAPKDKMLRIDPYVEWGTYYGGTGSEIGKSIAIDSSGNVFLVGKTNSSTTISSSGAHDTTLSGNSGEESSYDAFLVKFNSNGERLWGTYYGGSGIDMASSVAISSTGYLYVTGTTTSSNGISSNTVEEQIPSPTGEQIRPMIRNTMPSSMASSYIAKFNSNGNRLWSTYLHAKGGGSPATGSGNTSEGIAVATSPDGLNVYVLTNLYTDFNTTTIAYNIVNTILAFIPMADWLSYAITIADIAVQASGLLPEDDATSCAQLFCLNAENGTYVNDRTICSENASTRPMIGTALAVGESIGGSNLYNIYVTGYTRDDKLQENLGGSDYEYTANPGSNTQSDYPQAVIVSFSSFQFWPGMNSVGKHRYYGGSHVEIPTSIAAEGYNHVYIAGMTRSPSGLTLNAFDSTYSGNGDGFLAKIDMSNGNADWATYYGGTGEDIINDIKISGDGNIYAVGTTRSSNDIAHNGYMNVRGGVANDQDAFLVRFTSTGDRVWGTYVGGDGIDKGNSLAIRTNNKIYVAGTTYSAMGVGKGSAPSPYKPTYGSDGQQGFIIKYAIPSTDSNGILYVKKGGSGDKTGRDWNNAIGELSDALQATKSNSSIQQIWVSKGIYNPISRPDDIISSIYNRDNSFRLANNVKIYGGFAGTESSLNQRNLSIVENSSILDGNIGDFINQTDNAYHVVVSAGNVGTAELNGFTIRYGSANGTGNISVKGENIYRNTGAGIYISNSSPRLTNLKIVNNNASDKGSGVYNFKGSPIFVNVEISNNSANYGAGIFNENSTAQINEPQFINTTITKNNALINGGGISNKYGTTAIFKNTILYANTSGGNYPNIFNEEGGNTFFENSIIESVSGWQSDFGTDGGNNIYENPQFFDSLSNNFKLLSNSPAIDSGNNSFYSGLNGDSVDLDGFQRIRGGLIDIGSYEIQEISQNCSDWSVWKGTSWSNGIPDINKKAVIRAELTLDTNLQACELEVTTGGILVIPLGKSFTVSGKIINTQNAENLIVQNGGNLIQVDDVENTGAITAKRSTFIKHLDYTIWSSPVIAQGLQAFSPLTLANRIRIYDGQPSVNNWVITTGNFVSGKGYMFRAPNANDGSYAGTYNWTGTFTGTPENGEVTAEFNTLGTYQSIGNPYPSNIDRVEFHNANPDLGTLYFWTNTNSPENGVYVANNWATINRSGDVVAAIATEEEAQNSNVSNGIISVGQGFVAETNGAIPQVVFNNTMRTSNSGVFFRTIQNERHRLWLDLSNQNQTFNQMLVGYMEEATNNEDFGIDSKLFGYTGSALYSLIENNQADYIIQGRSLPFNDYDVVSLGFRAVNNGSYTISLSNFDGLFAESQNIYLKDNFIQTEHNLKNGSYTFVSESGTFDNRFEIVYRESSMSVTNSDLNNSWIVYKQDNTFQIQTQGFDIRDVMVYDTLGRKVYEATNINDSNHTFPTVNANQMLIVKILSTENQRLTKKVKN